MASFRSNSDAATAHEPSPSTSMLVELLSGWTRQEVQTALDCFDNPQDGLLSGSVRALLSQKKPPRIWRDAVGWQAQDKGGVVGVFDTAFPPLLKFIPDPPLVLYYRGHLAAIAQPTVAIVGARRSSSNGRQLATHLGAEFAKSGCCVVSGLAAGVDAAAHEGALVGTGGTVAFLGSGLEQIYPRRHVHLADRIIANGGAVISEYPGATPPKPFRFPERNRLISGASMAVVVVEASRKSGSLITARFALEQGRDVFACPGPVQNPLSAGCHDLIRNGAGLLTDAQDVLDGLGLESVQAEPTARLAGAGAVVYAAVGGEVVLAEEIAHLSGLDFALVCRTLIELELNGFVRQEGLGYIRTLTGRVD